jgi:hypothetical protein
VIAEQNTVRIGKLLECESAREPSLAQLDGLHDASAASQKMEMKKTERK